MESFESRSEPVSNSNTQQYRDRKESENLTLSDEAAENLREKAEKMRSAFSEMSAAEKKTFS